MRKLLGNLKRMTTLVAFLVQGFGNLPKVYLFWRELILADLADFIKIRQMKSLPKLNKNNIF